MNLDTTSALSTGFASKIGAGDLALYITEDYLLGAYPPLLPTPSPSSHPSLSIRSTTSLSPPPPRRPSSSGVSGRSYGSQRIAPTSVPPSTSSMEPQRGDNQAHDALLLRPVQLHPTGTTGSALDQLLDPTCATLEHSQLKHKSTFNPHHRWLDHIRAASSLSKLKELSSSLPDGGGTHLIRPSPTYHASTVLGLTAGLGLSSSSAPSSSDDVPTLSAMGPLVRRLLGRLLGPTIDHSHCGHLVSSGLYLHSLLGHHGGISAFRISLEREATAKQHPDHHHASCDRDVNISDDDVDTDDGLSMNPLAEHMRIGGFSTRSKRVNINSTSHTANKKRHLFDAASVKPVVSESMRVSVCVAAPSFLASSMWEDYPLLRAIVTLIVATPQYHQQQQPTSQQRQQPPRTPQSRVAWVQGLCGINATAYLRRVIKEDRGTPNPTDEAVSAAHDILSALEELFVVPRVVASEERGGRGNPSGDLDGGSFDTFIRRLICIVVAMEVRVVKTPKSTTDLKEHTVPSKTVCELAPYAPADEAGIRGLAHMLTHIKWELAASSTPSDAPGHYQNHDDVEVTMGSLLSVLRTRPSGAGVPSTAAHEEVVVPLRLCMLPDELYCTATRQLERAWQRRVAACYVFPVEGGLLAKTSVATASNAKRAFSVLKESCANNGGGSGGDAMLAAGVSIRDIIHVVGCAAQAPIPIYTPPPPQLPPTAVPMPVATGHFSDMNRRSMMGGGIHNTSTTSTTTTRAASPPSNQQPQYPLGNLLGNAAFDLYTYCLACHCDQEDSLAEARNALDQLSLDVQNSGDEGGAGDEYGLNLYGKVVSALEGRRKLEKKQVHIITNPNNGVATQNEEDVDSNAVTTHHSFDPTWGVMQYSLYDCLSWPVGLTQQQDSLLAAPDTTNSFAPNKKASSLTRRSGHSPPRAHLQQKTTTSSLTLASCFAPGTASVNFNGGDSDEDDVRYDAGGPSFSSPSRWGRVLELTSLGSANQASLVRKLGEVVKTDPNDNNKSLSGKGASGSFSSGVPLSSSSHRTAAAQLKTKREAERLSADKNPALTAAAAKFTKYRQSAIVDPEFLAFVHELISRSCKSLITVFSPVFEVTRGPGGGRGGMLVSSAVRDTSAFVTLHLVAPPPSTTTTSSSLPHHANRRQQQPSYDVLRYTAYHVGITTSMASQLLQTPQPSDPTTNFGKSRGGPRSVMGNMTSIQDTQCTSSMTFDDFAGKYFPLILHQTDVMNYMRVRQESATPLGDAAFVLLLCDTLHLPHGSYVLGGRDVKMGRRGNHADVELLGEREVVHGDGHIHLFPAGIQHLLSLGTDPLPPPSPLTSPRKTRRDSRDKLWKAGGSSNGGSRRGSMQRSVDEEGSSRRSSVTSDTDVTLPTSKTQRSSRLTSQQPDDRDKDVSHQHKDLTRAESPSATDPSLQPAHLIRKGSSALFAPKASMTSTRQQMAEAKHKSRTVKSPLHVTSAAPHQQQQQHQRSGPGSVACSSTPPASQRSVGNNNNVSSTIQSYKPPVFVADEPADEASFKRIAASREAHHQSVLSRNQRKAITKTAVSSPSPPRTGRGKAAPAPLSETALKQASSMHCFDNADVIENADHTGSRVGGRFTAPPSQHQQPLRSVYSAARSTPISLRNAPPQLVPPASVKEDIVDDASLLPPWKRGGGLADHVRMNNSARHRIETATSISPKPKTHQSDSARSSSKATNKLAHQQQQRSATPTTGGKVVSYSDWIHMMNNTLGNTTTYI